MSSESKRAGEACRSRPSRSIWNGKPPRCRTAAFDVIVVVHYLHRPLFPQLLAALRPGGVLVYETFTTAQAARGKPTNPDFLLRPGRAP